LEEHIASIFSVKSKPSKKPQDAGVVARFLLAIAFNPEEADNIIL
jgi:hypothetical protein